MTNEHDNQGAREALVEQLAEAMFGCPVTNRDRASAGLALPVIAAQVEAAVSVVRAEARSEMDIVEQDLRKVEADARTLREGLEALADEMAGYRTLDRAAPWVARLRALLAPSPAEGKGERPPRKTEGTGGLASGGTIVGHAGLPVLDNSYFTPAPVSSGEAGGCTRGCGCKITCRRAGSVTPSTEDEGDAS